MPIKNKALKKAKPNTCKIPNSIECLNNLPLTNDIHGILVIIPAINTTSISLNSKRVLSSMKRLPPMPNIEQRYCHACDIVSDRKSTHPKITNNIVSNHPTIPRALFLSTRLGKSKSFSIIIKIPYRTPHRIKVQFAPCQIPVANQTIDKLKTRRVFEDTLEPPNGKYK